MSLLWVVLAAWPFAGDVPDEFYRIGLEGFEPGRVASPTITVLKVIGQSFERAHELAAMGLGQRDRQEPRVVHEP